MRCLLVLWCWALVVSAEERRLQGNIFNNRKSRGKVYKESAASGKSGKGGIGLGGKGGGLSVVSTGKGGKGGKGESESSKSGRGKGKGGGKGKDVEVDPPAVKCDHSVATLLQSQVPEVITKTPPRCCDYEGPIAVYVTHAESEDTNSGFEDFWDLVYKQIEETSAMADVCFVMTGYNQRFESNRTLSDILTDVNFIVSMQPEVQAQMATEPTVEGSVVTLVRSLLDQENSPSVAIFNTGWLAIELEGILTGLPKLPYVGLRDDSTFGSKAAAATQELLAGVDPRPLCLNGRPDLDFVGLRCRTYYESLLDALPSEPTGFPCNLETTPEEIFAEIVINDVNSVLSHFDCCAAANLAVEMAEAEGRSIVIGCTDNDTSAGGVDFVSKQPIELQAYSAASWANFPVIQAKAGNDGRGPDFFPSIDSLVSTDIFNEIQ